MKYSDFLFELGVEELPSKEVLALSKALEVNIGEEFSKAKVEYKEVQSFGSPRRIAVIVKDVAHIQASQSISRRGPAVAGSLDSDNQPMPSLRGFAKSCGVSVDALTTVKTEKGEWWLYEAQQAGVETRELLVAIVNKSVERLPVAKLMTWGDAKYNFCRPVHWAVMLFGSDVIEGEIFAVKTSNHSYGHRFHHPEAVTIANPAEYVEVLQSAKVVASFTERRKIIYSQLQKISTLHDLSVIIPDDLLDEVTSIVEWPNAILANFDEKFLQVPAEAIIASLQQHQKCFALNDKNGKLSPHFITVSNIESDKPEQVIAGNEKVVRARLSDAAFFYEQDSSQPLANFALGIDKVVFHNKLGSLADKVSRITSIMHYLAPVLDLDPKLAARSAFLAKCDLLTGMVGEFPELQGVMGYYYAQKDAESYDVALAIKEHYYPRFAADTLPTGNYGLALSIADRIDSLVGLFAAGQKPSGVKDPFKLRRHALALVRILLILQSKISLPELINKSIDTYKEVVAIQPHELATSLLTFIFERMQSYYHAQGIDAHFFHAVRALQSQYLCDIDKRVHALLSFKDIPESSSLAAACKRVDNIIANVELTTSDLAVDTSILTEQAECDLFNLVQDAESYVALKIKEDDYQSVLAYLAKFKQPLDTFFDQVMVMVDDERVKYNRINLLIRLQKLLKTVADIAIVNI